MLEALTKVFLMDMEAALSVYSATEESGRAMSMTLSMSDMVDREVEATATVLLSARYPLTAMADMIRTSTPQSAKVDAAATAGVLTNASVTLYVTPVVGVVSSGKHVNHNGINTLSFWSVYLPGTGA
jgi:hypothetical protein